MRQKQPGSVVGIGEQEGQNGEGKGEAEPLVGPLGAKAIASITGAVATSLLSESTISSFVDPSSLESQTCFIV